VYQLFSTINQTETVVFMLPLHFLLPGDHTIRTNICLVITFTSVYLFYPACLGPCALFIVN